MGGSLGFADPAARVSFGYTMNKQGRGVLLNERGQSLVDATYRSLGYGTNECGRWIGNAIGRPDQASSHVETITGIAARQPVYS
jgi:hypothetical protein